MELAEEARNSGVEKKQSFLVEEVQPQVTGMTRPVIEPVSVATDEDLGQLVEVHREGTARVPNVKFEAGQLMQWPDIKSDGVRIRGIMLELEMSPFGFVRRTAGPVSVAAKSEMITPVFAGGVVAAAAPLAVVEAVTSRVSVLPVVGSDLLTGLSAAAGVTDQLSTIAINVLRRWSRPKESGRLKWPRNGLCELSENYKWKSCTGTVPRSIQYPGGDLEVLGSPCLRSQEETTGSVDRKGQYDDADWFSENPNRAGGTVVAQTDATVAQYCSYIKGILTNDWAVSNRPAVKVSTLGYPSRLVKDTENKDTTWIRLTCVWFYNCQAGQIVMSSSKMMPVVTRPRTIEEVPSHLSESFLRHLSDSHLDKLYDLPEDIQDVMGLQALRPSAAVCKVMTIPNSNCVRIVTPDEHVSTGFHEILVYDMGQEEWPQVPLSDIGCLRLDWLKDLFAFVGRYQLELEQMRKACRDRFGPAASGTCPTCEKYIQVNLGKHVALYHLDLAQLWRCPVAWCPVWKGTSQDCVDHMRRAHNTPISVKAGNLARWFPPWTVTREQWHSMSRPSVSGIAIDTFLFSRIGMPLFHRYRVFDRLGGHPAFRGPYMFRLFAFLKEADAESIRRSHRR